MSTMSVRERAERQASQPEVERQPARPNRAGMGLSVTPQLSTRQRQEIADAKRAPEVRPDPNVGWYGRLLEKWAEEERQQKAAAAAERKHREELQAERQRRIHAQHRVELARIFREQTALQWSLTEHEYEEAMRRLTPAELADPDSAAFDCEVQRILNERGA